MSELARVRLVVFARPLPMPRPRVTARGTYSGDPEHRRLKATIRQAAALVRTPFFVGPLKLDVDFYLPTESVTYWKRGSGDLENMLKLVADALEDQAYANDSQIAESTCRKFPATDGRPRLEITLEGTPGDRPEPKPRALHPKRNSKRLVLTPAVYRKP